MSRVFDKVLILFFSIVVCMVEVAVATPQDAAVEAQLGIEQYNKKQFAAAYQHMAKAAALDPGSEDYQIDAAILAELAGNQPVQIIPFYHRATKLASKRKDYEAIQVYNRKVFKLAAAMPEWVAQKREASRAGKSSKSWQAGFDQLSAYVQQKKFDKGADEGERLLDLAVSELGAGHPDTLKTQQKYAFALFSNGQPEEAFKVLQQAEQDAATSLGGQHPDTQMIQLLLGQLMQQHEDFDGAVSAYRRALKAYNESLGAGHPQALDTAMRLARAEELRRDFAAAAQVLLNGCTGATKLLGDLHLQTGECFQQLGLMSFRQGDNAKSQFAYGKSSGILRKVAGKTHPAWVQTQIFLADLARSKADYAESERILTSLVEKEEIPANQRFEAKGILAVLYEDQGLFGEAEVATQEILTHETETLGELHPNTITSLNNLAGIHRKQSRLIEAEKGYELALERSTEALGEKTPATLAIMNNLALTLETAGLYDRAEPLFRKALKLSRSLLGDTHPTTLANMNNLALLHESQGVFDKSESLYQEAIELMSGIKGDEHPDTVAVKNNLGYLYLLQERNEDAAEIFDEVLEIWQEILGDRHQNTMKGMNNLGRVMHGLGDLEAAEELISQALELRIDVLGENHMDVLRSQHDLGKLYMDMERYEESMELLQKTLEQADANLGELHPYTFETLNTLAILQYTIEDIEGAFETQKILFDRRNKFLDQMLWATSENSREGYIRLHRPELYRYMNMVSALEPEDAGRELMRISLFRKGMLLQVASQIMQVAKLSDDPALTAISDELLNTRKELAAMTLSGPTEETATTFIESIHELEVKISELEGELGRASVRFREAAEEVSLDRLEEHMPDDSALVDYLVFRDEENESKLQVAIMRKEEGEISYDHHLYEGLDEMNTLIKEFREIIQDEDADDDEVMEFGMEVYNAVWAPIAERTGEIENIYVVPDGLLNILPFNAMVTEDEAWLLSAIDLHSISSSRDLIPSDIPMAQGGYMIMAGPDYDTDEVTGKNVLETLKGKRSAAGAQQAMRGMSHGMRSLNFDPLPGAEKEGRLIEEQTAVGDESGIVTHLIQRKEAQEELLRKMEQPPEVLHIATHGFFLKPNDNLKKRLRKLQRGANVHVPPPGDNPLLRAGLAFAGLNANAKLLGEIDTDNDGVLTALEVLGLDLSGTRMAVLSACETGLGEIHEGEGVYGLRRSFQEAGVGAVVNSLWEVSDAGTQALMIGLYQRMLEGEDAHSALRNTQLEMLDSDEWNYPYVWSAFFMVEGATRTDS